MKLLDRPPYLRSWSRRFRVAGRVLGHGITEAASDVRLLAGHTNGDAKIRQARAGAYKFLVRANEDTGRQIYCFGEYEVDDAAYVRRAVRETDVCMDIGANIGYYSILLGSLACHGVVHSFEPVPLNYHLLCANLLLNGLSNVVANCCAVGDANGETDFVVARDSGLSSLVDTHRVPTHTRMRVAMSTLDDYCRTKEIGRIDFLKADVEGAEEKVIDGASGLLRNATRRPRLVMLEAYDPMLACYSSSIEKLTDKMQAYGYAPYVMENGACVRFGRQHYNHFYNVFFVRTDERTNVS